MNNNKRNILIVAGVILASLLLFLGIISSQISGDKIAKNTYVDDVNVGGLTKEDAKEVLDRDYEFKNLKLYLNEQSWEIEPQKFDLHYDIDKSVDEAYNFNREGNFIENIISTTKSNFDTKKYLKLTMAYDEEKLKNEIEVVANDINVDAVDASINITNGIISVNSQVDGLKVNLDETLNNAKEAINNEKFETNILAEVEVATIKKEELEEVDTILGSYTTKFDSSVAGRTTNIRLATERTSNVLLMPGDTFSYNEHTGKRSAENGYKDAPVIVQGVVQEGIGGGVCQVSSTLFNATLYAGLEYINLRNHSIPSSYVEMGRDAVVSDSGLDFSFKNNLTYPIYIKNYVSGNTVTCQVYGSSKDKQNIEISTTTDKVEATPTKTVNDNTLPKGQTKVISSGRKGYTVSTYRSYKDNNGNVLRQEKVTVSTYPKKEQTVAVGTLEVIESVEEVPLSPVEEAVTQ
jgi:vancomycin resistance protein YoaR